MQELELIRTTIKDSGLPEAKMVEVLESLNVIVLTKMPQWETLDNNTVVIDHEDKVNMRMAESIRKSIAEQRIAAVKHIAAKREAIASKIKSETIEDKVWLKISQLVDQTAKKFESSLKFKEKTLERYTEMKIMEIRLKRMEELSAYVNSPESYLRDDLAEGEYIKLKEGLKLSYEQEQRDKEQRRLEAEEQARQDEAERKRVSDENIRLQAELRIKEQEVIEARKAVVLEQQTSVLEPIPVAVETVVVDTIKHRLANEEAQIQGTRIMESPEILLPTTTMGDQDKIDFVFGMFLSNRMQDIVITDNALKAKYDTLVRVQNVYLSKLEEYYQSIFPKEK